MKAWWRRYYQQVIVGMLLFLLVIVTVVLIDRVSTNQQENRATQARVAKITAVIKSPCQRDPKGQPCIHLQVSIAKHEPRRVICVLFRRAGYPCRQANLSSFTLAAHRHRCHRRRTCYHRRRHRCHRHHRCHHHHHRCGVNFLGIRVCIPKTLFTTV